MGLYLQDPRFYGWNTSFNLSGLHMLTDRKQMRECWSEFWAISGLFIIYMQRNYLIHLGAAPFIEMGIILEEERKCLSVGLAPCIRQCGRAILATGWARGGQVLCSIVSFCLCFSVPCLLVNRQKSKGDGAFPPAQVSGVAVKLPCSCRCPTGSRVKKYIALCWCLLRAAPRTGFVLTAHRFVKKEF